MKNFTLIAGLSKVGIVFLLMYKVFFKILTNKVHRGKLSLLLSMKILVITMEIVTIEAECKWAIVFQVDFEKPSI